MAEPAAGWSDAGGGRRAWCIRRSARPRPLGGTNRRSSKSLRQLTSTRCRVLPVNTKMPCRSRASVIAWESASAQANSSLKILPPCTPSEELPSRSSAVVTSRLLGSRSRKMRGSTASPVRQVDVVADVLVDVQVGAVLQSVLHRRGACAPRTISADRRNPSPDAGRGSVRARSSTATWSGMKVFVHEFHSGYGMPGRCSGVTSRSLSCGRLGGGRLELRTPPSPPTGIECGAGSRFCVVVQGILPKVRRNLSDRPCGSVYALGQRCRATDARSSGCARAGQCDSAVEHLLGVHIGGRRLEVGQQPAKFGQQPGPVLRDPAERDTTLDEGERSAAPAPTARSAGSSTSRSFDGEHCSATPHVSVLRVQSRAGGG